MVLFFEPRNLDLRYRCRLIPLRSSTSRRRCSPIDLDGPEDLEDEESAVNLVRRQFLSLASGFTSVLAAASTLITGAANAQTDFPNRPIRIVLPYPVGRAADAITDFVRRPGGGLVSIPDSFTGEHREQVIAQAAHNRVPALFSNLVSTSSGSLMAYAVDTRDPMHRAAGYVDRVLKGDKPAELPVQQPAKFELSINLKTAKALRLRVPLSLIARADGVIE
jgi:hypothetical protein